MIETVVENGALGLESDAYREAIASVLASTDALARLIPCDHSEDTIRRFLELLRDHLPGRPTKAEKPWGVIGLDVFSCEESPISSHANEPDAREAAKKCLDELELEQPAGQTGGQDDIQDRIFVVGPKGQRNRVG